MINYVGRDRLPGRNLIMDRSKVFYAPNLIALTSLIKNSLYNPVFVLDLCIYLFIQTCF